MSTTVNNNYASSSTQEFKVDLK
ncbi:hypothetical protein ACTFIY_008881 [Dictyostelium cf. discoideum]